VMEHVHVIQAFGEKIVNVLQEIVMAKGRIIVTELVPVIRDFGELIAPVFQKIAITV
jgi:hypothetical protein